ncbi:MAG TPA: NADH-quinone oxidoreductase subunit NuoK [Candidatus Sumerlaeota bacterium]|nr:NADH-quinone oxidoreductase subunit NuoK [Candidatus Sumerlaeota bacterium]
MTSLLEPNLVLSTLLFTIGVLGVIWKRNAISLFMSVELMLSAVNINLIAFWRYMAPENMSGQAFAAFVFVVAAAEAAVGLAIIISVYRSRRSVVVEDVNLLKG